MHGALGKGRIRQDMLVYVNPCAQQGGTVALWVELIETVYPVCVCVYTPYIEPGLSIVSPFMCEEECLEGVGLGEGDVLFSIFHVSLLTPRSPLAKPCHLAARKYTPSGREREKEARGTGSPGKQLMHKNSGSTGSRATCAV